MISPVRGSIHRPVKTPCYGCAGRAVGCHSYCEEYAEYRAELEAEKNTAFSAAKMEQKTTLYEIESAKRYKRGGK